jgi:Tol biopolymer transport system component/PKD repeat protein
MTIRIIFCLIAFPFIGLPMSSPAAAQGTLDPAAGQIAFISTTCADPSSSCVPALAVMDANGANLARLTTIVTDELAWAPDGSRLVFASRGTLYVVPAGGGTPVVLSSADYDRAWPTWSPDGTRILFVNAGIQVVAAGGGAPIVLTNVQQNTAPAWSPDGKRIAFATNRDRPPDRYGPFELYVMNADGSAPLRLTTGVQVYGRPAWSTDGHRLVFSCNPDYAASTQLRVCAVNEDGSNFAVLGASWSDDFDPAWSPDGTRIAFATGRFGGPTACPDYWSSDIAVMNADGSNVTSIASPYPGGLASRPVWSPDGSRIAFTGYYVLYQDWPGTAGYACSEIPSVHVANDDGTELAYLASGGSPAWRPDPPTSSNLPPLAAFASACSGLACSFDASGSSDPDGTIASYTWTFGDGTTGSGATVNRTYGAGGSYAVSLTVADNAAATNQTTAVVNVNALPVASFTSACNGLACGFDASGSSDPGGTIASYTWTFGDGSTGSGATVNRTYVAGGTYTVILTVTDDDGATSTQAQSLTVVAPSRVHVGDLDGASTGQPNKSWTAMVTIRIHDGNHGLVANATVSGSWNNGGAGSCTTNATGQCAVSWSAISRTKTSVSFTVTNVAHATLVYQPADNHEPDGDSNGTIVTVNRQ